MCFFVVASGGGDGDGRVGRHLVRLPLAIGDMDGHAQLLFAFIEDWLADGFQQGTTNGHGGGTRASSTWLGLRSGWLGSR